MTYLAFKTRQLRKLRIENHRKEIELRKEVDYWRFRAKVYEYAKDSLNLEISKALADSFEDSIKEGWDTYRKYKNGYFYEQAKYLLRPKIQQIAEEVFNLSTEPI